MFTPDVNCGSKSFLNFGPATNKGMKSFLKFSPGPNYRRKISRNRSGRERGKASIRELLSRPGSSLGAIPASSTLRENCSDTIKGRRRLNAESHAGLINELNDASNRAVHEAGYFRLAENADCAFTPPVQAPPGFPTVAGGHYSLGLVDVSPLSAQKDHLGHESQLPHNS